MISKQLKDNAICFKLFQISFKPVVGLFQNGQDFKCPPLAPNGGGRPYHLAYLKYICRRDLKFKFSNRLYKHPFYTGYWLCFRWLYGVFINEKTIRKIGIFWVDSPIEYIVLPIVNNYTNWLGELFSIVTNNTIIILS